jgi:hypothetical protein
MSRRPYGRGMDCREYVIRVVSMSDVRRRQYPEGQCPGMHICKLMYGNGKRDWVTHSWSESVYRIRKSALDLHGRHT